MNQSPLLRQAVRGLVIDPTDAVLLVRLRFTHGSWWVLPGGGIDPGESRTEALRRELLEEVGLESPQVSGPIWRRTVMMDLVDAQGRHWNGQHETVYLVKNERFQPGPRMSQEELTAEHIDAFRWWSIAELTNHRGPDKIAPENLADLVATIASSGPPLRPWTIQS